MNTATNGIDLEQRLESLKKIVEQKNQKLKEEREAQILAKRAAKARDWGVVLAEEPDLAHAITQISKTFGKPDIVVVEKDGQRILDSRKYE